MSAAPKLRLAPKSSERLANLEGMSTDVRRALFAPGAMADQIARSGEGLDELFHVAASVIERATEADSTVGILDALDDLHAAYAKARRAVGLVNARIARARESFEALEDGRSA